MPSVNVSFVRCLKERDIDLIQVSLKDGASAEQLDAAKKQVTDQGGKIVNEFKLIKGFTAEFPADKVHTLQSNEHLNVEADSEVKTQ